MQKRGLSQIDWVLSMAIFILFVGYFFVFLKPNAEAPTGAQNSFLSLKTRFVENFSTSTETVLISIFSKDRRDDVPILTNITLPWNSFVLGDDLDYILVGGDLVFFSNLSEGQQRLIMTRSDNHTPDLSSYGMVVESYYASTGNNLRADFIDSMPASARYNGQKRMMDLIIYAGIPEAGGLEEFVPDVYGYDDLGIAARFQASKTAFNHTCYVYAKNSIIDCIIKANQVTENYTFHLDFKVENYTHYYSDNNNFGELNSSSRAEEIIYDSEYTTMYNAGDSLSFFLWQNSTVGIKHYNDTIIMNTTFIVYDEARYRFVFHQGDYRNITLQDYSVLLGFIDKVEAVEPKSLDDADYAQLKQEWNVPDRTDFRIVLYNSTTQQIRSENEVNSIGSEPPRKADVGSNDYAIDVFDTSGIIIAGSMTIMVW